MTTVSTHHHGHEHPDPARLLRSENITLAPESGRGKGVGLMVVGVVLLLAALGLSAGGVGGFTLAHFLGAYLVGAMAVLAMCLGSMFFVMAFHLTNAGWASTIRRQFENVMTFTPWAGLLVMPVLITEIATHGTLMLWLSESMAHDPVLAHKAPFFYLNQPMGGFPVFFVIRAVVYLVVWTVLARRLMACSLAQDAGTDTAAASRARFTSAWGMLIFALTTAFASFDWLMSLDFKFFSTMWGVYYFAGAAFSASALVAFVLARLQGAGKLRGVVTGEHFHDLGKLMFSFTVFWAYISFFQYFLIWYSNIPEETAFYVFRQGGPWRNLSVFLMVGHFAVPFVILLFRPVKKSSGLLTLMAVWALLVHVADIYWIVRPMVDARSQHSTLASTWWADLLPIAGLLAVFAGRLTLVIPKSTLVPSKDPWMPEAIEHRNYV